MAKQVNTGSSASGRGEKEQCAGGGGAAAFSEVPAIIQGCFFISCASGAQMGIPCPERRASQHRPLGERLPSAGTRLQARAGSGRGDRSRCRRGGGPWHPPQPGQAAGDGAEGRGCAIHTRLLSLYKTMAFCGESLLS